MNADYGYGVDGMLYHISQLTVDPVSGKRYPKKGAQCGYILKATEFGEMPELTPEAAAYVAEWRGDTKATADEDKVDTGYGTKVDTPAPATGGYATKVDAPADDAPRPRAKGGQ